MKKIDEIRPYLENGYSLNITTDETKNYYYGNLVLAQRSGCELYNSFLDIQEVLVDPILKYFPQIQEQINERQWLEISCSQSGTPLIISKIVKREFYGPYGEKSSMSLVGNLRAKTDDIFTAFIELNNIIALQKFAEEEPQKEQIKKF